MNNIYIGNEADETFVNFLRMRAYEVINEMRAVEASIYKRQLSNHTIIRIRSYVAQYTAKANAMIKEADRIAYIRLGGKV